MSEALFCLLLCPRLVGLDSEVKGLSQFTFIIVCIILVGFLSVFPGVIVEAFVFVFLYCKVITLAFLPIKF